MSVSYRASIVCVRACVRIEFSHPHMTSEIQSLTVKREGGREGILKLAHSKIKSMNSFLL